MYIADNDSNFRCTNATRAPIYGMSKIDYFIVSLIRYAYASYGWSARIIKFTHVGRKLPVIMLTADVTTESIQACKDVRIDAYLTKPIEPEKLFGTIYSLLDNNEEKLILDTKPALKLVKEPRPEDVHTIDIQTLNTLSTMAMNDSFLGNLIKGYLQDTKQLINQIEVSTSNKRYDKIIDLAHAIDGSKLCRIVFLARWVWLGKRRF